MIRETAVFFHDFSEEGMLAGNVLLACIAGFFSDRFFQKTVGADRYQRYRYSKQKEKPFDGSGDICILANIGCTREKTVSRVVRKPDGNCFAGMEKWFFTEKDFVTIDQS